MTESALQPDVMLIRFMIAVRCFQFKDKTLTRFSEWRVLIDECHPLLEV